MDLEAYFSRIGWGGPTAPTLDTLAGLHLAHLAAIPFENLDIQMGKGIRLDLEALEAKLVRDRRGGYCFEQNSLFAAVLIQLGFRVKLREARVRRGATGLLPRTHLALEVQLSEGAWLSDVGFGGDGPLGPVPFGGEGLRVQGERCRIQGEGTRQVLQVWRNDTWMDLYALEPGGVHTIDLELANHYTSTHPASRFVQTLTVQRSTPDARWVLRNLELSCRRGDRLEEGAVSREGLLELLRERFGIHLPNGVCFRALDGA